MVYYYINITVTMELTNSNIETTVLIADKCRYCLENSDDNETIFLKPCNCTDPICTQCLKKWIECNKVVACEICLQKFQIPDDIDIQIPSTDYLFETDSETEEELMNNCFDDWNIKLFLISLISVSVFMILLIILNINFF